MKTIDQLEKEKKLINVIGYNALLLLANMAFNQYSDSLKNNLKLFHELNNIKVGDYVFEVTTFTMSRGKPSYDSIGKVLEIKSNNDYVLEDLSGESVHWTNCKMIKIMNLDNSSNLKFAKI